MLVNITITNKDFLKIVFKKKTVILDSYIEEDIRSGSLLSQNPSCRHSQYLQKLVWSLIALARPFVVLIVLVFPLVVIVCPSVYPLVVHACLLVVLVCPLVVLSVGLFITDRKYKRPKLSSISFKLLSIFICNFKL